MEQVKTRNKTQAKTAHESWCAEVDAIDWESPLYRGCLSQVARVLGYRGRNARIRVWKEVHLSRRASTMMLLLSAARMAERGERELREQVEEVVR